jgi:hypothetical protein
LNRGQAGLELPAVEVRAVVGDGELNRLHLSAAIISRARKRRAPQMRAAEHR